MRCPAQQEVEPIESRVLVRGRWASSSEAAHIEGKHVPRVDLVEPLKVELLQVDLLTKRHVRCGYFARLASASEPLRWYHGFAKCMESSSSRRFRSATCP